MGVLIALILAPGAQSAQAPPAAADPDLERIRQELSRQSAIVLSAPVTREGNVFKLTIEAPRQKEKPTWADWAGTTVPSYVRPALPLYHHEFLNEVTPEVFRAWTLYGVGLGVDVVPMIVSFSKWLKKTQRRAKEAHARDEVRQAFEEFLACRADTARPGC